MDVYNPRFVSLTLPDSIAQVLMEANACPNSQCDFGETPLHRASRLGYPDCVASLVAGGADSSLPNYVFETPFEVAGVWGSKVKMKQRIDVRKVLYEQRPQTRTLILHHPDFLNHITREGHQEAPARVTSILGALRKHTGVGGLFEEWETNLSDEFDAASIDAIARAHSKNYIELIDSIHESLSADAVTPVPFTLTPQSIITIYGRT
jgi:hypothetical protein